MNIPARRTSGDIIFVQIAWALFSLFPAAIALFMGYLAYIFPLKK